MTISKADKQRVWDTAYACAFATLRLQLSGVSLIDIRSAAIECAHDAADAVSSYDASKPDGGPVVLRPRRG